MLSYFEWEKWAKEGGELSLLDDSALTIPDLCLCGCGNILDGHGECLNCNHPNIGPALGLVMQAQDAYLESVEDLYAYGDPDIPRHVSLRRQCAHIAALQRIAQSCGWPSLEALLDEAASRTSDKWAHNNLGFIDHLARHQEN